MDQISNHRRIVVFAFFAFVLILGLSIFEDYGIPWDEHEHRLHGFQTIEHMKNPTADYIYSPDLLRYYGPSFELLSAVAEKTLGPKVDLQKVYFLRHLIIFLFFFFALICFYRLIVFRWRDWRLGLFGCLLLVLSPRIFADNFYNSKDGIFMALFCISMCGLVYFYEKPFKSQALIFGLSTGFLLGVRLLGLLIPFLAGILFMQRLWRERHGVERATTIVPLLIYVFTAASVLFFTWPFLWKHPIPRFIEAAFYSPKVAWEFPMLFMGKFILPTRLPWYYIPVWIVITTPPAYVLLAFAGLITALHKFKNWRWENEGADKWDVLFIVWIAFPLVGVVACSARVYDGWRHLYFIYPGIILLAVGAVAAFIERFSTKPTLIFIAAVLIIFNETWVAAQMVRLHPYENVYFNRIAGRNLAETVKRRFELDYFGLSYRELLEKILAQDNRPQITICAANLSGWVAWQILSQENRNRIVYSNEVNKSDYFIGNYRWYPQGYPFKGEVYGVEREGAKLSVAYKISQPIEANNNYWPYAMGIIPAHLFQQSD